MDEENESPLIERIRKTGFWKNLKFQQLIELNYGFVYKINERSERAFIEVISNGSKLRINYYEPGKDDFKAKSPEKDIRKIKGILKENAEGIRKYLYNKKRIKRDYVGYYLKGYPQEICLGRLIR